MARENGRFLEALDLLSTCGNESCPGVLREECGGWLKELELEIPSLVVAVQDPAGVDITQYDLWIDEKPMPPNAAHSLRLDPGTHSLRARAKGYREQSITVVVRVKEQHRRVELKLAPLPKPESSWIPPWPVWSLGGLGLLGGGAFIALGVDARSSEEGLEECEPDCSETAVDRVRTKYTAANVSLVVGLAALSAAGVSYVIWKSSDDEPESQSARASGPHLALQIKANGAVFQGRF